MSIRNRILITINSIALAFLGMILVISQLIINSSFRALEMNTIKNKVDRVNNAIHSTIEEMLPTSRDWAFWTDTWNFTQGKNPKFIDNNLSDETFVTYKLNIMIIYDKNFQILYAKAYDIDKNRPMEFTSDLELSLTQLKPIIDTLKVMIPHGGFIKTNHLPMLLSFSPILKNDASGPIGGYLIMGKYFSEENIKKLSDIKQLQVSATPILPHISLTEEIKTVLSSTHERDLVRFLPHNQIIGWGKILDINDNPIFVYNVLADREATKIGNNLSMWLLILFLLSIVCESYLLYRQIDIKIIRRLLNVQNQVKTIAETANHKGLINIEGDDEITVLSGHINEMLISLQKAVSVKNEFLTHMSHEIRTPLNSIIGMCNLLARTNLTEEQKDYTKSILISGESLLTMINSILDFSRLEFSLNKLDVHPFNLKNTIQNVFVILRGKAIEKNLLLTYDIRPNVPELVVGDEIRLKQILINLIGNSIKFTIKGQVKLDVAVHSNPNMMIFTITDTGCGIEPDMLDRVFDPFVQVDNPLTRVYGGSGLGLSITKKLIELMNGSINITSKVGKGTIVRFVIELPSYLEQHGQKYDHLNEINNETDGKQINTYTNINSLQKITIGDKEPIMPELERLSDQYPLNILVVEDNVINLRMMKHLLLKLGYDAYTADNGNQALDLLRNNKIDMVFLDIQMPTMDGFQVTEEIIKHPHIYGKPIIIALTANATNTDKENCLNAGMNDYLSKPVSFTDVQNKIITHYSKKQTNPT